MPRSFGCASVTRSFAALLSELGSPHSCQTQFAPCSGRTPMPHASLPQAMLRATLQLHLAIPSNPIQPSVPSSWRIMPWLETSSSACALPSRRTSAEGASFAAVPDRIHSTTSATISFTFTFSSVSVPALHPSAASLAARYWNCTNSPTATLTGWGIHSSNFASFASWKISRVGTAPRSIRSSPLSWRLTCIR